MAISYGQFTGWVSVSYVLKSEPSCTSHKPRASYQRWLVRGDLEHEICLHAAIQSYMQNLNSQIITYSESGIIDSTVSVVVGALLVAAFFFVVDRDVVE